MAGCSASGRTPARSAGARTARPWAPEVWNVSWPARHVPVSARPRDPAGCRRGRRGPRGRWRRPPRRRGAAERRAAGGRALGGGGGEAGRGDDRDRGGECGAQDGADPAGADDAHAEAGGGRWPGEVRQRGRSCGSRHRCTSRSSPDRVPDVGCGPHRRDRSVRAVSLWCGPAVWRRSAAAGCVARVDRRWRVCDPGPPQCLASVVWLTRGMRAPEQGSRPAPTVTRDTSGRRGGSVGTMDGRQPWSPAAAAASGWASRGLVDRGARRPHRTQGRCAGRGRRVARRAGGGGRGAGARRGRRAPRGAVRTAIELRQRTCSSATSA